MKLKKILLEFCNTCNYDCIFCRSIRDNKAVLKLKDFKDFDYYIQSADIIDITGYGEITTHPEFKQIIDTITKYNKKIQMSTNGSLLTDEIITALENSNISILNVSLNSLNKNNYSLLTGVNNLEKVLINVDKLFNSKLKNKKNFDNSDVYLQCSFVINKINFYEIKDFIDFGVKYNIHISLKDLTPAIKDYDKNLILEDNEENRNYLKDCIEYGKRLPGKFHYFNFDNRKENNGKSNNEENLSNIIKGCEYIDNIIAINHAGGVHACCWMPTVILGNVKEKSIDEIMNSEIYNDLRENIKKGTKKYCADCRRLG